MFLCFKYVDGSASSAMKATNRNRTSMSAQDLFPAERWINPKRSRQYCALGCILCIFPPTQNGLVAGSRSCPIGTRIPRRLALPEFFIHWFSFRKDSFNWPCVKLVAGVDLSAASVVIRFFASPASRSPNSGSSMSSQYFENDSTRMTLQKGTVRFLNACFGLNC